MGVTRSLALSLAMAIAVAGCATPQPEPVTVAQGPHFFKGQYSAHHAARMNRAARKAGVPGKKHAPVHAPEQNPM
jgi:hypothetical protein